MHLAGVSRSATAGGDQNHSNTVCSEGKSLVRKDIWYLCISCSACEQSLPPFTAYEGTRGSALLTGALEMGDPFFSLARGVKNRLAE